MSLPCHIDKDGLYRVYNYDLDECELKKLKESAKILYKAQCQVKLWKASVIFCLLINRPRCFSSKYFSWLTEFAVPSPYGYECFCAWQVVVHRDLQSAVNMSRCVHTGFKWTFRKLLLRNVIMKQLFTITSILSLNLKMV